MNYKIAIDSGHGGTDPGNKGNGITEKEYSLLISNYIKQRLDDLKVNNIITRNTDRELSIPERIDIIERAYGNEDNVIVITNHINNEGEGLEVIYALRNTDKLSKTIANSIEQAGLKVNKYYQLRDPKNTSEDYYELLKNTPNYETIMIKYGSVNNENDVKSLKNDYKKYAEAIVQAITKYIGVEYKPLPNSNYYIVKKGDSLYQIAKTYNITVDELKKSNNLTTNNLDIGQILYLPVEIKENEDEEKQTYTVKSGDTLYKIAKTYNVTVDELKKANNLVTNTLQIGDILTIPAETNIVTYTVKIGDTLYKIANSYNITVDELKKTNNLATNTLQIGDILTIPTKNDVITYMVKSGDTLYKIANTYDTTVDKIKKANNLTSNTLQIGQKLIIN